jgi:hypothetical protein
VNRAEQASAFCSALFGGGLGDDDRLAGLYVPLWSDADKLTRWRPADKPAAVASLVAELDEQPGAGNVYIGVGLTDAPRGKVVRTDDADQPVTAGRTRSQDVAGLFGLWADVDIAGPGHSDAHYPESVDAARRVVDAMVLRPTLSVHSGGGLQVWWMFPEPWLTRDAADPDAERDEMARLAFDWLRAVQYQAERLGRYKIDSVFDLARLLRPAGTTNRKLPDDPRRVTVLDYDPQAVHDPDDFRAHLPATEILAAYAAPTGTTSALLSEAEAEVVRQVNFRAVWARVTSPAYREVDYTPEWLADILELEAEVNDGKPGDLGRVWNHQRPDLKDDENRFDAALVRLLAAFEQVDTEGLVEAVMCRRLRLPDSAKSDKVNPARRLDYIARTVARFRLRAAHEAQTTAEMRDAIDVMASTRLPLPRRPEPELEVQADHRGRVLDQDAANEAFETFTDALIEHVEPSEEETAREADRIVLTERVGVDPSPEPDHPGDEVDPFDLYGDSRSEVEVQALDSLTVLLIPDAYRARGIRVWAIEYRDYGERQQGRLLLRLPLDFDWPADRPSRYWPGRPLPTEWWSRNAFDSARGFQMALERDCKIVSRDDAPKADWPKVIRRLVPLWRRDSSGSSLAHSAHQWLYNYLMLHHGTGEPNEVAATGRPWVRRTNGWRRERPPVIYVDPTEFLSHCRHQPGVPAGRAAADIVNYLRVTRRRPRLKAAGAAGRPTWLEIEPEQFSPEEWGAIIEVTRASYDRSITGKGLRSVGSGERGYGIDGSAPEAPGRAVR